MKSRNSQKSIIDPTFLWDARKSKPNAKCFSTICFRVTRACNLRCPYCQAPPNGYQRSFEELVEALSWLRDQGARSIKFTGGEPFVYTRLLDLVGVCRSLSMEPTVVTNGTLLTHNAIECLRTYEARVKISLHGPKSMHDQLQGSPVYDLVIAGVRALVALNVDTSIHTLVHRKSDLNLEAWTTFLYHEGVSKVSFMPFVARGRGRDLSQSWTLPAHQIRQLKETVANLASDYKGRILVRYLDFLEQPYLVFETNGRFILEKAQEINDFLLPHRIVGMAG